MVDGRPLEFVQAPDPSTVVVHFPAPSRPGLRLLDNLPILPSTRSRRRSPRERSPRRGRRRRRSTEIAGLGPFVLTEHVSGQRLVFQRNPHYCRQ